MAASSAVPSRRAFGLKLTAIVVLGVSCFVGSYVLAAASAPTVPPPAPVPAGQPPSLEPVELSLAGHPQADWYLNDPQGQAVRAEFETGWQAVSTGDGPYDIGWIPTAFQWGPQPPGSDDVAEVVDGSGHVIGYWALEGGFVSSDRFDPGSGQHVFEIPWP